MGALCALILGGGVGFFSGKYFERLRNAALVVKVALEHEFDDLKNPK